jgi:hypothetical protein
MMARVFSEDLMHADNKYPKEFMQKQVVIMIR